MTYRAPDLAAECERLRYVLRPGGGWFAFANVCNTLVVVLDAFDGSHGPWRIARAVWCASVWVLWALLFVRRAPAEGGRS